MLRHLLAAVLVLSIQGMPATRLAGGGPGVSQAPMAPAPPAGRQLPPLPATQIDPRDAAASLDRHSGLTLSFEEPMAIGEVLRLLVEGTQYSLSIDQDATGMFRGQLKRLSLRDALTTLLTPLGLDYEIQGTVIRVMRHRAETRQYDLNLLNVQRGLQRTASNGAGSATISTTVNGDDVFASIAAGVKSLLSDTGKVNIDARSGLALVSDVPERLDRVGLYVESLQTRSARQVRLEARVFEVTMQAPSIDWGVVRERLGMPRNAPDAGLAADPLALRTVLAAQGEITDLWAPEVTTLNNEPAMVHITTPGDSSLTLVVVPQISADGIVQMSISHEWGEHHGNQKQGFMKSPTALMRVSGSDTVTRVMDGNTVLIAGLTRPREIEVKATTGMAAVFGGSQKQKGHAELVVLLRPTVVRAGPVPAGTR